jgi:hypothetical protein
MWGKQSTFENLVIRLREAVPYDGCEPYSYDIPKAPTAYLVNGLNKCPLSTMIHNAQAKNAKALIIVNHEETDIKNAIEHSHLPGVRIHVLLINKRVGVKLRDAVQAEKLAETHLSINFLDLVSKNSNVDLEVTYSPEDPQIARFFADFYVSKFASDSRISIGRKYTMLHCSSCAEQGFTMAKENCLSGGRYCMKSSINDDITGEVMLVQTLKNKCTEAILQDRNQQNKIREYYWRFNNSCIETFSPKCINAILKALGIKKEVFDCVKSSFIRSTLIDPKADPVQRTEPLILLDDNTLLATEMKSFKAIENYADFPLLKINGVIYYGQISFKEVAEFMCRHVKKDLKGCEDVQEIEVFSEGKAFRWFALILVIGVFGTVMELCRRALKKKMEGELAYKIDQSVSNFLERSGGTDL